MYCSIIFSQELPKASPDEVREWAEYQLGYRAGIKESNPLIDVELEAESISVNY